MVESGSHMNFTTNSTEPDADVGRNASIFREEIKFLERIKTAVDLSISRRKQDLRVSVSTTESADTRALSIVEAAGEDFHGFIERAKNFFQSLFCSIFDREK